MIKKIGPAVLIVFLIVVNPIFSWQTKLIRKIPMRDDKTPLLVAGYFTVMEDASFIFPDIKDKDYQLKAFDGKGRLIRAWGKMGPGPDEFMGACFLDYKSPYLAVQDAGKRCTHVLVHRGNFEFRRVSDIPDWEANIGVKLYGGNVVIPAYIVSPENKEYALFMRDFSGKKTEYLLPLENQYGENSLSGYRKIYDVVAGITSLSFVDVSEDTIFYVSDVRLRIAKIDAKTRKIDFIGHAPENFRPLVMNQKTKNDLFQSGKKVAEGILSKFSFVSGLFADKDIVGVIYVNREKKIGHELYFVPYVQIYDHDGKLLCEQPLAPVYSEEKFISFFYQKDKKRLYLVPWISNDVAYEYVVHEFSLEP